jgi:dienelactone hydrolase
VILVHGSNGIRTNVLRWADALSAMGLATFVLDSFTGRQITETATAQDRLSTVAMTVDAYRALDVVGRHPRIDPRRIAIMGFSKGGSVALAAALRRFYALHGSPGLDFAAYIALYPGCQRRFIDEENVVDRPIRIYHGEADDWVPIAPCRAYVDRLRKAGRDAELTGYPDAHHGFDLHLASPSIRIPNVQTGPTCVVEERSGGLMVSMPSGQPWSLNDPCVTRGATLGYHPDAHAKTLGAVTALLKRVLIGE